MITEKIVKKIKLTKIKKEVRKGFKELMTRTRVSSKQHNYSVSLMKKSKSDYFGNLNEKNINDNKIFWKTIKPFLNINKQNDINI